MPTRSSISACPHLPLVGSKSTLEQAAPRTLDELKDASFRRLRPLAGEPGHERSPEPFEWADVIAGDIGAIRRYAPDLLKRKTVVVEYADDEDLDDLTKRGVSIVVTLMPSLNPGDAMGRWSAAVVEATLVALRRDA